MTTETLPLKGKQILITRAKHQVKEFVGKLSAVGGVPLPVPLIEVEACVENEQQIRVVINQLKSYDCIVFTSANGVSFFQSFLDKWGIPYSNLSHLIAASVGRKTSKQMEKLHLSARLIPEEFVAEKLADHIAEHLAPKSKILVIRGNLARPVLVQQLNNEGYNVTDLIVYKTVHNHQEANKLKAYVENGQLDYITFTSSSTVDSFMKVFQEHQLMEKLNNIKFVCIGPITNKTLAEYGLQGFMPASFTIDDMVKLMIELEKQ
ncbi:uroporphyrinogen-III synthase [Metabacillus malikii]|uniref:Uroporphyrinogen-III synthase n=1 Tax=Metabacillus malikii TaxID=1504265 RepID=A0ABT9ZKI5_9BACI|nr:uroporphyrinogen-III synthase [Metabacillus malikii]MDQ0232801.1 uroporphyrinogen-III synthase [Metabacillus malikii]